MITSYELFLESIKDSDFIYNKYYTNKISKEDYETIRTGLGDGVNKLSEGSKWIIGLYLNNKFLLEDLYKAKEYLDLYFKYKNRLNTPLNTLNSIQELFSLIKDYRETEEVSFSNEEERKLYGSGQYKEVFKNNKYRIIIPITLEASKYFGKGTEWCTTSENMFKKYTKKQNPDVINIYNLYILYTENPNDRLQFHFKSIQYMDIKDYDIDIKQFFNDNKDIYDFFNKSFNVDEYIEKVDINLYNRNITSLKNKNIPNVINGYFDCNYNELTSLEDAPKEVGKWFDCSENKLTSLEGAPKEVGDSFLCHNNQLVSLKGAPKEVGDSFVCSVNQLTTLEGAPKEVGGGFDCSYNQLTSLKGAPKEVGGGFYCYDNQLTTLEGAPKEVGGVFNCSDNKLTSLMGAPKEVGDNFLCHNNKLTSLMGAPKEVGGNFNCNDNQLTSLEGAPKEVGGSFYCYDNPGLSKKEILKYKESGAVKGIIYSDYGNF